MFSMIEAMIEAILLVKLPGHRHSGASALR
jgi:hypothetical protein